MPAERRTPAQSSPTTIPLSSHPPPSPSKRRLSRSSGSLPSGPEHNPSVVAQLNPSHQPSHTSRLRQNQLPFNNNPVSPGTPSAPIDLTADSSDALYPHKRPKLVPSTRAVIPPASTPTMSKLGSSSSIGVSVLRPHTGARKLMVKNLRPANDVTRDASLEDYYNKLKVDIEAALNSIFRCEAPKRPYDGLYKGVEDLCRWGKAEELYKLLHRMMESHLRSHVVKTLEPLALQARGSDAGLMEFVRKSLECWRTWGKQELTIRTVFSYLDRSYLLNSRSLTQLNDLAITLFKKIVMSAKHDPKEPKPIIGPAVLMGIISLLEHHRLDDGAGDTQLLKDAISMYHVLGLYTRQLEPALLNKSSATFTALAAEYAESCSTADYIAFCETRLAREEEACIIFNLDSTTKKQLVDDANRIFIAKRTDKLLHFESISSLLADADNKIRVMKALFQLLKRCKLEKDLKEPWEEYIKQTGSGIVNDKERADDMVLRLLLLRRHLDKLVRDAFEGSDDFTKGLREAFGFFVNDKRMMTTWGTGTSKVGEMVAKYIDMLLRTGLKALPRQLLSDDKDRQAADRAGTGGSGDSQEAELDRQLDNALELFRFIQGKDVFEAFYKTDLARRLLMNRSASQDAEKNMLTKFRGECGSSFTQNLEQMFKDRDLANEDMRAYKMGREAKGLRGAVDLHVSILSAAAWPTYPDVPCKLPEEIYGQICGFDEWYLEKHTGRRLTWKHNLAQCVVVGRFDSGKKDLMVSGFQAVVLLLFNNTATPGAEGDGDGGGDDGNGKGGLPAQLSYQYIANETGIPAPDLMRTLQSLACGRVRVLTKVPKGRDVHPSDRFEVNRRFSDPRVRIKINTIQMKETPQENRETHERVAKDRMFETQAAIVRVLKGRKRVGHQELVAEVVGGMGGRGKVDVGVVKENIEKLIDKDYMERDPDTGEYVYMA